MMLCRLQLISTDRDFQCGFATRGRAAPIFRHLRPCSLKPSPKDFRFPLRYESRHVFLVFIWFLRHASLPTCSHIRQILPFNPHNE